MITSANYIFCLRLNSLQPKSAKFYAQVKKMYRQCDVVYIQNSSKKQGNQKILMILQSNCSLFSPLAISDLPAAIENAHKMHTLFVQLFNKLKLNLRPKAHPLKSVAN